MRSDEPGLAFDTIEWDSGIDLDPEFVYEKCERKGTRQDADANTIEPRDSAPAR